MVANTYNAGAAKLGDINPDFLAAVYDLTSEKCSEFNNEIRIIQIFIISQLVLN